MLNNNKVIDLSTNYEEKRSGLCWQQPIKERTAK